MTIRDITEQIEIQGRIIVKKWNDYKETYDILVETENALFKDNEIIDMEITYMYAVDDVGLVIEVK